MKPQLSLLTSTALSATYPVSLKLIYAAEGAPLSPAVITSLRFALMAGGAAFILSDRSAGASVEQPWWSSRRPDRNLCQRTRQQKYGLQPCWCLRYRR